MAEHPSPPWRGAALRRRALLAVVVLAQTAFATEFLREVLPYHGGNWVEIGLLALFALLFLWISIGFWIGLTGFLLRRVGGDPLSLMRRHSAADLAQLPLARTAVVMPVYHEPVARTLGGLAATYRSLEATGELQHFDFFVLSDSRNPEHWLAEKNAWYRLSRELGAEGRLFYRRRPLNLNYKSGNVGDFLRRWGRHYEYLVVLDADSLMSGESLLQMVRLMQAEPRVGILQTNPLLANARSLFARAQQFASQVYGPLFSTGLAAFQLGEAAFWGHNAILRIAPFMRHCGLRKLTGPGLFNGPISSHDFVEAAYIARAGHEVWLEPGIAGSYEESPPALGEELARDKRWAKGNLQHLWLLLFAPRLRLAHRLAFLNGVMSYLASPLWLAFLVLSTVAAARLVLQPIDYFPTAHSPFPVWPEWRPEWALQLALSTLALLFLPKLLAIVDVLLSRRSAGHGGVLGLSASVVLESVLSTLLAPIRMLAHSRHVFEALANVSLRWAGQNRGDETAWGPALRQHAPGALLAAAWVGFAWWLDTLFFYWSLPVALPLLFAAPTAVLTSRIGFGTWARRHRLLRVPEEQAEPPLFGWLAVHEKRLARAGHGGGLAGAIIDPLLNRLHAAEARGSARGVKGARLADLCRRCLREGPEALNAREQTLLAHDPESLRLLHHQVWRAAPDSYWARALHRYTRSHLD